MKRIKNKFIALVSFIGTALPLSVALAQEPAGAAAYAGEYEKLASQIISVLVIIEYGFLGIAGILIILALCQYLPANGDTAKTGSAKNLFVLALVSAGIALLAIILKTALPLLPDAL